MELVWTDNVQPKLNSSVEQSANTQENADLRTLVFFRWTQFWIRTEPSNCIPDVHPVRISVGLLMSSLRVCGSLGLPRRIPG